MKSSRYRRLLVLLAMFAVSGLANAQPAPAAAGSAAKAGPAVLIAQDIAAAGRLRMQSQRLSKLYLLAAQGVNAPAALRQITAGSAEMDGEFGRLARHAKKPAIARTYARCETSWQTLRGALQSAYSPVAGERVNQAADELMIHAGKLAMLIEAEAETPVGRLLDLSSRLNMLAQRLARLYLMAQGGDKSQGLLTDIEQARKEFAVGLKELDTAQENSLASREAIALAKNQWIFFDSAISQLGHTRQADSKPAQHVATSSERIAQVLDALGTQYARDYAESPRSVR